MCVDEPRSVPQAAGKKRAEERRIDGARLSEHMEVRCCDYDADRFRGSSETSQYFNATFPNSMDPIAVTIDKFNGSHLQVATFDCCTIKQAAVSVQHIQFHVVAIESIKSQK
jgi:hypothetical protein